MGGEKSKQKKPKMIDNANSSQYISSAMFGLPGSFAGDHLRKTLKATDDEMLYLKQILNLRLKKRQISTSQQHSDSFPSVVIDDFLYHGDLGHATNIGLLNHIGIRHIINVCDCSLDKNIIENFNVLWINLHDELRADIKQYFDETNQFLYDCKKKNEKVLVHCQMGISRSSSVILAYLMKYHHDSLMKAYDYLLERRPIAAPNLSFFLQLIRYEKELRVTKEIDEAKHNDDKRNPIKELNPTVLNTTGESN